MIGEGDNGADMLPLDSLFGVEIAQIDVRRIDEAACATSRRGADDHWARASGLKLLTDDEAERAPARLRPL